jgi:hypothetical protein
MGRMIKPPPPPPRPADTADPPPRGCERPFGGRR